VVNAMPQFNPMTHELAPLLASAFTEDPESAVLWLESNWAGLENWKLNGLNFDRVIPWSEYARIQGGFIPISRDQLCSIEDFAVLVFGEKKGRTLLKEAASMVKANRSYKLNAPEGNATACDPDEGVLISCAMLGQISDQRVVGDVDCSQNLRISHTQNGGNASKTDRPTHEAYISCLGHKTCKKQGAAHEFQRNVKVIPYICFMAVNLIMAHGGDSILGHRKQLEKMFAGKEKLIHAALTHTFYQREYVNARAGKERYLSLVKYLPKDKPVSKTPEGKRVSIKDFLPKGKPSKKKDRDHSLKQSKKPSSASAPASAHKSPASVMNKEPGSKQQVIPFQKASPQVKVPKHKNLIPNAKDLRQAEKACARVCSNGNVSEFALYSLLQTKFPNMLPAKAATDKAKAQADAIATAEAKADQDRDLIMFDSIPESDKPETTVEEANAPEGSFATADKPPDHEAICIALATELSVADQNEIAEAEFKRRADEEPSPNVQGKRQKRSITSDSD